MICTKKRLVLAALAILVLFPGCLFTSKTRYNESQTQNRILSQQNSAQLAEIGILKSHQRDQQNRVERSEQEVAMLKEQLNLNRQQLANYEREHELLYEQFKQLTRNTYTTEAQGTRNIK
jgi:hypothetical protein